MFSSITLGVSVGGTLLEAEIVPTLVFGSKVTSLPDKFLRTTSTHDPPGFNSVVLPGTKIFHHLGDDSTNM